MTDDERKARHREACRRYRAANPGKIAALKAQRKADGRNRGDQLRYYERHADDVCERQRDAYATNPARQRERRRRSRNVERELSYGRWYRRRGKGSGPDRDPKA